MTVSAFIPDPDKAAELVQILLARNGKQRGDELSYQCFHGERHKNGDVHTSASYNVVKHAGNCRVCGATYGFIDLAKLAGLDLSRRRDNPREPITLAQYAEQKHLNPALLAAEGVADVAWPFDGIAAIWIPAPTIEGKQDGAGQFRVRRHGPDHLMSAKGQRQRPYGLNRLAEAREAGYVIVVEGFTDALTLWQYGEPALALPGASPGHGILSQLPRWLDGIPVVYVVKEPDAGGDSLVPLLAGTSVRDRLRIVDPRPYKDVNAAHVADPEGFRAYLFAGLSAATEIRPATKAQDARNEGAEGRNTREGESAASPTHANITTATLADVETVWRKWMGIESDAYPLHVVLGTYAANRLEGDPVWVVIVGGSGSGKTEAVMSLNKLRDVRIAATLTGPAALLSGTPKREKAKEATGGLLRQIGDRGVLVLKDFTTILSMHREQRAEVIAALREIYDGQWTRDVGADGGRSLKWEGKLGLVAASTGTIDNAHAVMSTMGARFLFAREPDVDRTKQSGRARGHAGREREMRGEIAEHVQALLENLPSAEPPFPEEMHDRIVALADIAALARSPVERNYRSEIELVLEPEAPTRIVKQLAQLLRGLVWVGLDQDAAWNAIARVGRDSIPQLRRKVIDALLASPAAHMSTREIAANVAHPSETVRRALEDLDAHGVVEKDGEGQGQTYHWWISDYALDRLLLSTLSEMSEVEL